MNTNTIENIWYLPSENTWKELQTLAMKDIGVLAIYPDGFTFKGSKTDIAIKKVISLSYGKQGRDWINNWVKVEYVDYNGNVQKAFFADGNNRGWAGIFGGTKRIYNLLNEIYRLDNKL